MSKKDFLNVVARINKETNGDIRIADNDFQVVVDSAKFYKDSLYYLLLRTKTWNMTYYRDIHEYESGYDGSYDIDKIAERLSKKYGETKFNRWEFTHKIIYLYRLCINKEISSEYMNMVRDETWTICLDFTDKILKNKMKAEEEKILNKEKQIKDSLDLINKENEKELINKKESFAKGL